MWSLHIAKKVWNCNFHTLLARSFFFNWRINHSEQQLLLRLTKRTDSFFIQKSLRNRQYSTRLYISILFSLYVLFVQYISYYFLYLQTGAEMIRRAQLIWGVGNSLVAKNRWHGIARLCWYFFSDHLKTILDNSMLLKLVWVWGLGWVFLFCLFGFVVGCFFKPTLPGILTYHCLLAALCKAEMIDPRR